ncbi:MAG TPA: type 4a pilus biogenesis protein PilO [Gemmatimonadales bacterium]|jgi:Tfp pilus assembly protein PilO|nr:type 4a pilus biogenesis protein PilO [Gemmatimonadales bacterium]
MAENQRAIVALLVIVAAAVGYTGYTGDGISMVGLPGLQERVARVSAERDTIADLQTKTATATHDLAKESLDDVKARVASYRTSLAVLRGLVPEQREVANLIDQIAGRARVHGVTLSGFVPVPPVSGPAPFDTYSYQWTAIGRFNNIGAFLTDVASLQRIIVPGDVSLVAVTDLKQARALGDTTAMLEAHFTVRTYVKAKSAEDSTHAAQ